MGIPMTLPRAGGGLGLLGVLVFLAIQVLGGGGSSVAFGPQTVPGAPQAENGLRDFSVYVFHDTQKFWEQRVSGYQHAKLVLYRGGVDTGCGSATSAVGPFYCPRDQRVYLDLSFYNDMTGQLGAKGGDFAWAYVIAHEMGHHVQNLAGLMGGGGGGRQSSVAIELQADCLAGAWAKSASARNLLEVGDVDEALNAATQIGDDTIQRKAQGYVQPETFTHGSAAQRSGAFRKGLNGGAAACGIR